MRNLWILRTSLAARPGARTPSTGISPYTLRLDLRRVLNQRGAASKFISPEETVTAVGSDNTKQLGTATVCSTESKFQVSISEGNSATLASAETCADARTACVRLTLEVR